MFLILVWKLMFSILKIVNNLRMKTMKNKSSVFFKPGTNLMKKYNI